MTALITLAIPSALALISQSEIIVFAFAHFLFRKSVDPTSRPIYNALNRMGYENSDFHVAPLIADLKGRSANLR